MVLSSYVDALILLINLGKLKIDDIKNEEYKVAVQEKISQTIT